MGILYKLLILVICMTISSTPEMNNAVDVVGNGDVTNLGYFY